MTTRKLRTVLSLFDGMSCGQIALKELGVEFDAYYASEVDQNAINHTQLNFPDTIQLGDVTRWREWDIDWSSVDLLLAGSPCQGFSCAGTQNFFDDPRSKLYWEFSAILKHVKLYNPNVKWLLENVMMPHPIQAVINNDLQTVPICINSDKVSAQNRLRNYWTNLYDLVVQANLESKRLVIRDILDDPTEIKSKWIIKRELTYRAYSNVRALTQTSYAITATSWRGMQANGCTVIFDPRINHYRRFTIRELARLQTIPDWYKFDASDTKIIQLLGNGWTVKVIEHILSFL